MSRALSEWRGIDPESSKGKTLFRHNVQSARVVQVLEKDGQGLNLSREVVDGILCHTAVVRQAPLKADW